jgi:molybdopterin-guanine dinucleotide biosynthesis protein A
MGRDKASLPFGDEPLLLRVVRLAREVASEVLLVAREGQALPGGLDAVRDPAEGLGPLAGIAAGWARWRANARSWSPATCRCCGPRSRGG